MTRSQHPIESESYRILRSQVDTVTLPPLTRAVTERLIHTCADLDYATDLICDESALRGGARAPAEDAPLVVDDRMRAAGLPGLSNRSPQGGTAVAAAAVDALLYLEQDR